MVSKRLTHLFGLVLLIVLVAPLQFDPGKAQSTSDIIHRVLTTVVDKRIPAIQDTVLWGYTTPYKFEYIQVSDFGCPGEVAYLYGDQNYDGETDLWGAMSIQACPSESAADQALQAYQPFHLNSLYRNVEVLAAGRYDWQGYESQSMLISDVVEEGCTNQIDQVYKKSDICDKNCDNIPIEKIYMESQAACTATGHYCEEECSEDSIDDDDTEPDCEYYYYDRSEPDKCGNGCWKTRNADLTEIECIGTGEFFNLQVWQSGNYLLMAHDPIPNELPLSVILSGCGDCKELSDLLREEAEKAGLKGPGNQASAPPDQQAEPAKLIAQIGIIPNPPVVGKETTFTVDVSGYSAGEALTYSWFLDKVPLCQAQSCSWQAVSGHHSISVIVESKTTKRQADHALGFDVVVSSEKPIDNKDAGFVIDYLGCSDNITSDETLTCTAGFSRQKEGISKLTAIWLIDGYTVSTESHTDNGSVFSMDKPAPGTHTLQLQLVDPNTGMARVKETYVTVVEGSNATLPPGSQVGAAVGTLSGIGVWIWYEWYRARRATRPVRKETVAPEKKKFNVEAEDTGEVMYDVEKTDEKEKPETPPVKPGSLPESPGKKGVPRANEDAKPKTDEQPGVARGSVWDTPLEDEIPQELRISLTGS